MREHTLSRGQILVSAIVFGFVVSTVGTAAGAGTTALTESTVLENTAQTGTADLGAVGGSSVSSVSAEADAVSFVSAEEEASTHDDYQVDAPDNVQEGDLLIMTIGGTANGDDGMPYDQGDGWTRFALCSQDDNGDTDCPEDGQDLFLHMFYKVATDDEPDEYDVDVEGNTVTSVMALRGADTDDPIESVETLPLDDSADVSTCPSTEGVDGGMLICGFTHDDRHELENYGDLTLRTEDFNGDSSTQVATKQLTDGGDTTVHTPDHVDPTGNKDINIAAVVRPGSYDGGDDGGDDGGSDDGEFLGNELVYGGTNEMSQGDYLESANGDYRLSLQGDGNLVLRETSTGDAEWASDTADEGGTHVKVQGDGNFVMYTSSSDPVWASGPARAGGNELLLEDDGALVLYDDGSAVWSVNGEPSNDGGDGGGSDDGEKTVSEGADHIVKDESGMGLGAQDGNEDNGASIHQDDEDGGTNQQWQVDHLGNGEYRLVAQHSDKVAAVEGTSTADNADVHQWGWHGGNNQRWYIDDLGDGEYAIRSVNSGKVLEVADGQSGEDANVHQDTADGGANQRWRFESVDGGDDDYNNGGIDDDVADGSWGIVAIPDTQNMDDDDTDEYADSITDWVVDNADARNIAFVTHAGDMVSNGDDGEELDNIDDVMSDLDGVVPWSPNVGNHDFADTSDRSSGAAQWKDHFGASRFEGRSYFGGASDNGRNFYQTFSAGGYEFVHISLEWEAPGDPDDPGTPIGWAQDVMDDHPNTPTIITTHSYLTDEPRQRMEDVEEEAGNGNSGQEMWDKLVEHNPQVFMVLNGHNHHADDANDGEYHQVSTNDAGENVYEMLADYQDYDNGGNGWFRQIRFVPGGGDNGQDRITVQTYTAYHDEYQSDDRSEFHFDLDFDSRFSVSGGDDGGDGDGLGTKLVFGGTDEMFPGDFLESTNGDYRLYFQADGNLVLRDTSTSDALWASGTAGDGGTEVDLQDDGNLVIYTDSGDPVWASDTAGSGANELLLEDDGALVLYDDGSAVWSVNGEPSNADGGDDASGEGVFAINDDTIEADYQPDFEIAYPNYVYFEYSTNGGDWQYKLMNETSDNHFETTLGGLTSGDDVDYVFTRWEDGEWKWTDVKTYTFQPDG